MADKTIKISGFHLEESKRNKGAMLLIATDEEGDRWVIGGNGFGLGEVAEPEAQ